MVYKVIFDNGQIYVKRSFLFGVLMKDIELGEWYKSRKNGKYYLYTNYTVDLERIKQLIHKLKNSKLWPYNIL